MGLLKGPRGRGAVSYERGTTVTRKKGAFITGQDQHGRQRETEIFIDNLLVRVHFIIEMILVDRPCATGV